MTLAKAIETCSRVYDPNWRPPQRSTATPAPTVPARPPQSPPVAPAPRIIMPAPRSFRELMKSHPELRPPVLEGLLRRGETMNIIAPPKTGKSWLVTDLALSVASGQMWLGRFAVHDAGDVLILDNELHGETTVSRIPKVARARQIALDAYADRLHVENLRGKLQDIFSLKTYFDRLVPGRFKMIVLDAFYRFLPMGTDEN